MKNNLDKHYPTAQTITLMRFEQCLLINEKIGMAKSLAGEPLFVSKDTLPSARNAKENKKLTIGKEILVDSSKQVNFNLKDIKLSGHLPI